MSANPKILTTRVFRAGNSLAVRIPAQFKLAEGEVTIEQRAGGLFINDKRGDWASFFRGGQVDFPLTQKELRHTGPHREVDTSWADVSAASPRKVPESTPPPKKTVPKKSVAKNAVKKTRAKKSVR